MYNAVGIDVSKGKSTVIRKPFDIPHTSTDLSRLSKYLGSLDGETRIVMECTGRYHEPMANALHDAGLFVSVVNPHLIKNFGTNSLRKVKSDPADARKGIFFVLSTISGLHQNNPRKIKTIHNHRIYLVLLLRNYNESLFF